VKINQISELIKKMTHRFQRAYSLKASLDSRTGNIVLMHTDKKQANRTVYIIDRAQAGALRVADGHLHYDATSSQLEHSPLALDSAKQGFKVINRIQRLITRPRSLTFAIRTLQLLFIGGIGWIFIDAYLTTLDKQQAAVTASVENQPEADYSSWIEKPGEKVSLPRLPQQAQAAEQPIAVATAPAQPQSSDLLNEMKEADQQASPTAQAQLPVDPVAEKVVRSGTAALNENLKNLPPIASNSGLEDFGLGTQGTGTAGCDPKLAFTVPVEK
jgi:hypothetical protein